MNKELLEEKSLFKHEQSAIDEIKRQISNKEIYQIASNLLIHDSQTNYYYEYDMVVFTSNNIYVIELKHWSGHIKVKPYSWVINHGHYRNDPHKSNIFKCKILKGIYQHRFKAYPNLWVESVVVLTNPEATVEGADAPKSAADKRKKSPTFSSIADFITYIIRKNNIKSSRILEPQQIYSIAEYFNRINQPKHNNKFNVPGYETIEYLSQKQECIELVAKHISGRIKGLKRFRVFRAPVQFTIEEKRRFLKKAYNTIEAVSEIGDHANIHKVNLLENDVEDIIEVSDWSDKGTLKDIVLGQGGPLNKDLALEICFGILLALKKAHEVDIIHRSVKPENILMMNNIPKIMNFDLAYKFEEDRLTVIADPTKLKDDGYIAPEILIGQDIDESTDFFSLGAIAYELLTGVKAFSSVREFTASGGKLSDKAVKKLKQTGISEDTVEIISKMLLANRSERIKDLNKILDAFKTKENLTSEEISDVINPVLQAGNQHDVYEIVELIGGGAEAQVYLAKTLKNQKIVLKLFHKEVPRERIFREAEVTSNVKSTYVAHSDNKIGHWNNDRYFLVIDYIAGKSMREIIDNGNTPDIDTFRTVAMCLMEAVEAFHFYKDDNQNLSPLLHSDIKPDNIIITDDKKAVLIDCGLAGEPRTDIFQGTTGYIPPDSILGTDMQFSQSGDLFALGVTLWEWVFGDKPYENPAVGDKPDIPQFCSELLNENLCGWLCKAVASEAENRFSSIVDMRDAFIEKKTYKEDKLYKDAEGNMKEVSATSETSAVASDYSILGRNPFVYYLNSLSNASAGNENATAESQINNEYFNKIHVENPIQENVYKELIEKQRNVVLTGNAGDGKTTIAVDIYKKVSGHQVALPPIIRLKGTNLVIVKDMSELSQEKRVEILDNAVNSQEYVYLIISNTGTLLNSFKDLFDNNTRQSELLNALKANSPQTIIDDNFIIINIGRTDSISTACNVFKRMLEEANWFKCKSCDTLKKCPIHINYQLISQKLSVVLERIELLYKRLYEYGTRLTLRQMTGHLAFALTGGLDCQIIKKKSVIELQDNLSSYLFFNRFFGDDGNEILPSAKQLFTIQQIRNSDLGIILDSSFERKIWMKRKTAGQQLSLINIEPFNKLSGLFKLNNFINRRQVRRLIYLFEPFNDIKEKTQYISVFLRSPLLQKYIELCRSKDVPTREENMYKRRIMQVLQEFFTGVRFPERSYKESSIYITLNRHFYGSGTQMVLADFKIDDFRLSVKSKYQVGECLNGMLNLQYCLSDIELELDLPFLDYVARRYEGEVAEDFSAFYADRLERFKVHLLKAWEKEGRYKQSNDLRLLMISSERNIELKKIVLANGQLEVL